MSLLIGKALKVLKQQLKGYFYFFFFFVPFFPELASGPYLSLCCDVQGLYKVILKQNARYCGSIM